jgi:hypothetical protein
MHQQDPERRHLAGSWNVSMHQQDPERRHLAGSWNVSILQGWSALQVYHKSVKRYSLGPAESNVDDVSCPLKPHLLTKLLDT